MKSNKEKILRKCLLLALLVVFWGPLHSQTDSCTISVTPGHPWTENFESFTGVGYNVEGVLPPCWGATSDGSSAGYMPHVVSGSGTGAYIHSGNNAICMTSGLNFSIGLTHTVTLPSFSQPLNTLHLSFWMCTEGNSDLNGTLTVGYITTHVYEWQEFHAIQAIASSSTTAHSGNGLQVGGGMEVDIDLDSVPTNATHLVFHWQTSMSDFTCCIDDIVVSASEPCPRVTNLVAEVTGTDALLSWDTTSASLYEIVVSGGSSAPSQQVVSVPSIALSGLEANTTYSASIRAICGTGDTSLPKIVNFRTDCAFLTFLPFTEDFEGCSTTSTTSTSFIDCWGHLNDATTYVGVPYIYNSSSKNHTPGGSKVLNWNDNTASTYGSYTSVILPGVDTTVYPINHLQLTFFAKSSSASTHPEFYVGVMSDPTDITTFQPVDTFNLNDSWMECTSYFNHFTGYGAYVAVVAHQSTGSWIAYVDDFVLEVSNSCIRPSDLQLVTATRCDSVVVDWSEVGDATAWQLFVGTTGMVPSDTTTEVRDVMAHPCVLTDLTLGQSYDIYVRANCGDGYSNWRGPMTVVPGSYNFPTTGVHAIEGCNVSLYDNGGAGANYSASCNTTVTIRPGTDEVIQLWGTINTESGYDFVYVYDGENISSPEVFRGSGNVVLDTITSTVGPITIKFTSDGGTQTAGFDLHSSCVPAPPCGKVTNITCTPGPASALISWTPGILGEYTGAIVEYRETTQTTWITINTSNTYVGLTNLTPQTTYEVRVTANCTGGAANAESCQFTTSDFVCAVVDTASIFYNTVGSGTTNNYTLPVNNYYKNSFTEQLYLDSEIDSIGTISAIKFQFTGSNTMTHKTNCQIYLTNTDISVITNSTYISPEDMTLVYSGPLTCVNGWNRFEFDQPFNYTGGNLVVAVIDNSNDYDGTAYTFATHSATSKAMALYSDQQHYPSTMMNSTSYSYRNNVSFEFQSCLEQETCPAPIVVAEPINSTTVCLTIVPGNTESTWNISVRQVGDSVFSSYGTATSTTYLVNDLLPSTMYEFRIESVCSGNGGQSTIVTSATNCDIEALPFTEDMEDMPTGQFSTLCWGVGSTSLGTDTPFPTIATLSGSSNKLCVIYNGGYLVLPEMAAPLNRLRLRFDLTQFGVGTRLVLGVLDEIDDAIANIQGLDTLVRSNIETNSYTATVVYDFSNLPNGATGHIVIYDPFADAKSYIDNIVVDTIPTCPSATNLNAVSVTTSNAVIGWQQTSDASGYQVEYGPRGFHPGTGTTITDVTNSPVNITGLEAGTNYDVYVLTICLNDTVSSSPFHFTTLCGTVSLPYEENFDNVIEPGSPETRLPNCWTYAFTGSSTSSSYLPRIYIPSATGYTASGNYCLYLYGNAVIALPQMPTTLDSLMVSFYDMNTSPSSYGLIIGAVDSITPGFENSFVPIDTVEFTNGANNLIIFLDNYTGTSRYLAFKNFNTSTTSSYSYHYIDNLVVDRIPSCRWPMGFRTTALSTSTASIGWSVSSASDFEYEYGPAGFVRGSGVAGTCHGCLATLGGLTTNTSYDFYARAICGTGDTSIWSECFTFTTSAVDPVTSYPYICDFTDTLLSNCGFVLVGGTQSNQWTIGNAVSNGNANSLYVSNNSTDHAYTNNSISISYAYRDLDLTAGSYNYSFDWLANGESSYDYLRAWLVPVSSSVTAGQLPDGSSTLSLYTSSTPADWISLDGGSKLNLSTSWNTQSDEVYVPETGTYHLMFMWGNDLSSGNNPPAAIDNISISVTSCPRVQHLSASVSGTTVDLDWVDSVSGFGWEVEYGITGFIHGSADATSTIVTSPSFRVSGLDALTNYDFLVRHICSATDTGNWAAVMVATGMCDSPRVADNATTSTSSSAFVPAHSNYNYSFSQTIIDSADLTALGGLAITGFAFHPLEVSVGSLYEHCQVFLTHTSRSTFNSESDVVNLDSSMLVYSGSLNFNTPAWRYVTLDTLFTWNGSDNLLLTLVRNEGAYLNGSLFEAVSTTGNKVIYGYTDNYPIDPANLSSWNGIMAASNVAPSIQLISCVPFCAEPEALTATSDHATATLSWQGTSNAYQVAYRLADQEDWNNATLVTDTFFTLTNLMPATQYLFRVRAVCDTDLVSEWVTDTLHTDDLPCEAPSDLHTIDISGLEATFDWTPVTEEGMWVLHVWNGALEHLDTVSAHPVTISGLSAATTYNATIQSLCDYGYHSLSDTITFTTLACDTVTDVTVSAITTTTAVVTWNAGSNNTDQWEIAYGLQGFDQGLGNSIITSETHGTLTNLEAGTDYDLYVRAICTDCWISNWSDVIHFTTRVTDDIHAVQSIGVNIFPNPAINATTISVSGINGRAVISVVDVNGSIIKSETLDCTADCTKSLDVESLAQGTYFVRISSTDTSIVKKLIVK